jgi:signal transduction histidine kinase
MGLRLMAYRAAMIGGKLTIKSEEGTGTSIVCTAPKRKRCISYKEAHSRRR